MKSDGVANMIVLMIFIVIVLALLFSFVNTVANCDGTLVRGIIGYECITK